MKTLVKNSNLDLKVLVNLKNEETLVFGQFYSRKGSVLTTDKLIGYMGLEGVSSSKKGQITKACKVLADAGIINVVETGFVMPAYETVDLDETRQLGIGGKVHTTLTANPNQVFYVGDAVLYMPHPLSQEYKSGQRVSIGEVKSFHVNEEGFLYLIVLKASEVDVDGKMMKRKECAVKASQAQLLDSKIPEVVKTGITYKKAAGIVAPELNDMPDLAKGRHILFFNNVWNSDAKHMSQVIDGLVKAKKVAGKLTVINTDHQAVECKAHNVRIAGTLVVIENGKEIARQEGIPLEAVNETIMKLLK